MLDSSTDPETKSYIYELLARVSMLSGDREAALRALEQSCALWPTVPGRIRIHPEFAPLRSDPRFQRFTSPPRPASQG